MLQQHKASLHIKYMHQFINFKAHAFLSYCKKVNFNDCFGLYCVLEENKCWKGITQHKVSVFFSSVLWNTLVVDKLLLWSHTTR